MSAPASPGVEPLLAEALRALQEERLTEAERLITRAVQLDPSHPDALHVLASFSNHLGNALSAGGELDAAVQAFQQALQVLPTLTDAFYNLALTLQKQGKFQEAVNAYRQFLISNPDHPEAHNNLGNSLQRLGRLDEAVAAYTEGLKHRPDHAQIHSNLGNALMSLGQLSAAADYHSRAIALQPDFAEAYNNLGVVLIEQNQIDAAVGALARAVQLRTDYAEGWNNLAIALRRQGKTQESEAVYRHVLSTHSDSAPSRLGFLVATIPMLPGTPEESAAVVGRFEAELNELETWHRLHPGMLGGVIGSIQPFHLAYRPYDITATLERYGELICNAARENTLPPAPNPRAIRSHIRLVVVTGQIGDMLPVWEIVLRGLIAHLDRNKFEIIVYHPSLRSDAATLWTTQRVDRFIHGRRSPGAWLDELIGHQPDVIFYPELGMDPVCGFLAAHRVAPLQVVGWGHPVTSGFSTLDWFISGELLESESAESHYSEKLVRLPGTGVCTEWPLVTCEPWQGPPKGAGVVRFALCHQPIKFDAGDDALLTRIARATGQCEFWLSAPGNLPWAGERLHQRLDAAFRSAGLDPVKYLRIAPWLTTAQFAGFLDEMDIYLDCPAFSGYTTAWHAIHRGLPIVTCEGPYLRQRLAAGLLRQIEMTEGITSSKDEYVERAVLWAQDCRHQPHRARARRDDVRRAAPKADGNRAAVAAFERAVLDHFGT